MLENVMFGKDARAEHETPQNKESFSDVHQRVLEFVAMQTIAGTGVTRRASERFTLQRAKENDTSGTLSTRYKSDGNGFLTSRRDFFSKKV